MARAGARHPGLPPPVSLQRRYAPTSRCFGCGPANEQGLRIESHEAGGVPGELRATWQPRPHHAAFENVLNGGIIGTLLDCHANWTAAMRLMRERDLPVVDAELASGGIITATCRGTFVAVGPDHPAFERW